MCCFCGNNPAVLGTCSASHIFSSLLSRALVKFIVFGAFPGPGFSQRRSLIECSAAFSLHGLALASVLYPFPRQSAPNLQCGKLFRESAHISHAPSGTEGPDMWKHTPSLGDHKNNKTCFNTFFRAPPSFHSATAHGKNRTLNPF